MSLIHLNESSSGATRNSGTNGDLVALLDWALVTNGGWTIAQTASNARVYQPASGSRFLFVHHDSAVSGNPQLAVVRGCESASSAAIAGLTNPFPTVAQVAAGSSNWLVSTAASTVSRAFDIYVTPSWMAYFSNASGTANQWEFGLFGDVAAFLSGDTYNTICLVRSTTSTAASTSGSWAAVSTSISSGSKLFWCRSFDGTVLSSHGNFSPIIGIGNTTNMPAPMAGPSGMIEMEKMGICDLGSATTTPTTAKALRTRGWFPNIWNPLHSGLGAVNARDTWTDTAYNGSATFKMFTLSPCTIAVEETNTWSAPGV